MILYKNIRPIVALFAVTVLAACSSQGSQQQAQSQAEPERSTVSVEDLDIATGQTIYIPAYSEINIGTRQTLDLAITLSIHNSDLNYPIVVSSVRYYDANGNLVQEYVDEAFVLGPMASTEFVIEREDQRGGVGANFIVEWISENTVSEPVAEAVMIGTGSQQGISFISPGRIVSQIP